MTIPFTPRHVVLGTMLCITLAATVWVSGTGSRSDIALPAENAQAGQVAGALTTQKPSPMKSGTILQLYKLQQRVIVSAEEKDVFTAKSWYVPPPPPPKAANPAPPPPPAAPQLPFKFMGLFQEESGKLIVYLANGDRAYAVSEGDVIDNIYRIDAANTRQLVLTYLPLSITQTLPTGTGS